MKKKIASIAVGFMVGIVCIKAADVSISYSASISKSGLVSTQADSISYDIAGAQIEVVEIGPLAGAVTTNIVFQNLTNPRLVVLYVDTTTTNSQEVKFGVDASGFQRIMTIKEGDSFPVHLDTNVTIVANWPANETNTIRAIGWSR